MREIKFRAWDKENKKYFKPIYEAYNHKIEELHLSQNGRLQMRTFDNVIDESLFPDRFEIQLFTGLHDKNGKEIYEGDIVKDSYPAGFTTYKVCFGEYDNEMDYEDNDSGVGWYLVVIFEHYYVEKWKEQAYDKYFKKGQVSGILYPSYKKVEVIGNIYENPELVKNC